MKKTLLYALSLSALVLGVTGCKNGKEPEKPKEDTTTVHSAMKTLAEASELRIETAGSYSSTGEITYNSAVEFSKDACIYTVTTSANRFNSSVGGLFNIEGTGVGRFFEANGNTYNGGYVDTTIAKSYEEFVITFSDFFNTFVEGKTAQQLKTEGTYDVKEYSLDLSVNSKGQYTNKTAMYQMVYLSGMLRLGSFTSYITDMTFKASNGLLSLEVSLGGKLSQYTVNGSFNTTFLPESNEYLPTIDFVEFGNTAKQIKVETSEGFKKFSEMVNTNTYAVKDVPLTSGAKADVYYSNEYWGFVMKGTTSDLDEYNFYVVNSSGGIDFINYSSKTENKFEVEPVVTAAQLKQERIAAKDFLMSLASQFGLDYLESGSGFTNYSFLAGDYEEYTDSGNKGYMVADFGNCFGLGTALDSTNNLLLIGGYVETGVVYDYDKNGTEEDISDDKVYLSYLAGDNGLFPFDDIIYTGFGVECEKVYNYLHSTAK